MTVLGQANIHVALNRATNALEATQSWLSAKQPVFQDSCLRPLYPDTNYQQQLVFKEDCLFLTEQGSFTEALDLAERMPKGHIQRLRAIQIISQAYLEANQPRKALSLACKITTPLSSPNSKIEQIITGCKQIITNNITSEIFENIIQKAKENNDPKSSISLLTTITLKAAKCGRWETALKACNNILENLEKSNLLLGCTAIAVNQKNWNQALELCSQIPLDKQKQEAFTYVSRELLRKGTDNDFFSNHDKLPLELLPDDVLNVMSQWFSRKGNFNQASQIAEKINDQTLREGTLIYFAKQKERKLDQTPRQRTTPHLNPPATKYIKK